MPPRGGLLAGMKTNLSPLLAAGALGAVALLAGCASEPASHVVSAPPPLPPATPAAPAATVYTTPAPVAAATAVTTPTGTYAVPSPVGASSVVAMQAPPPTAYRRGLLDRLDVTRWLDQPTRMILRRIERFPGKAALTVAGLIASLALLVGTQFMFDALDHVVEHAYYRTQRWNEQLGFFHPRQARAVTEATCLPGVLAAERERLCREAGELRSILSAIAKKDDTANAGQTVG